MLVPTPLNPWVYGSHSVGHVGSISTPPLRLRVTQCRPCWFHLHSTPASTGHTMSAILVPTPFNPLVCGSHNVGHVGSNSIQPLGLRVTQCRPCWFQLHSTPGSTGHTMSAMLVPTPFNPWVYGSHNCRPCWFQLHSTPESTGHTMSAMLVPTPLNAWVYGSHNVGHVGSTAHSP